MSNNKSFGKLSTISETLQRCYLGDPKTEIYFSNLLWPDFNERELDRAIETYNARERRYGSTLSTKTDSKII